jgi:hypothetical protein
VIINRCTKEDISDYRAQEKAIRRINIKHITKKANQEATGRHHAMQERRVWLENNPKLVLDIMHVSAAL